MQDIIDRTPSGIIQIDGIGKKRFWEIADVMINVSGQNEKVWQWNSKSTNTEGAEAMGKKKKQELQAVYRIVDTETSQIVFVGYTKELTRDTLKTKIELLSKEAGGKLEGHYVLDYFPVNEKKKLVKEREKFFRTYHPLYGTSTIMGETELATEEDNTKWKPFFSGHHDGIYANRNILKALEKSHRASVLKETKWWKLMKAVFDSPDTERALNTIGEAGAVLTMESVFMKTGNDDSLEKLTAMRTAFIQFVNERLESAAVINQKKEEDVPEEVSETEPETEITEPELKTTEAEKEETAEKSVQREVQREPDIMTAVPEPEIVSEVAEQKEPDISDSISELLGKLEAQRKLGEKIRFFDGRMLEEDNNENLVTETGFFDDRMLEEETEEKPFETVKDFWEKTIQEFGKQNPALSGLLKNSSAFIMEDKLLITAQNPDFMRAFKIPENAAELSGAVTKVFGRSYRLLVKKDQTETEIGVTAETMPDKEQDIVQSADVVSEKMPEQAENELNPLLESYIRRNQWELFFKHCVGEYIENAARFSLDKFSEKEYQKEYRFPYFANCTNCQDGRNEKVFFAVADDLKDYEKILHLVSLYGIKAVILHDVNEKVIYADSEVTERALQNGYDSFDFFAVPYLPEAEYQLHVRPDGRLYLTKNTVQDNFTESCMSFLNSGRDFLKQKYSH